MKLSIVYILAVFSVFISAYKITPYKTDNSHLGKKIGTTKNDQYIITVDTLSLKEYWEGIIDEPDIKLTKLEIIKGKVVGKKNEEFYMLVGHAKDLNAKAVRWLIKHENDFYFYAMTETPDDNDGFYCTYYFNRCNDNSPTLPMALYYGEGYSWSTSEHPTCETNSPCTGTKTLIIEEEYPF